MIRRLLITTSILFLCILPLSAQKTKGGKEARQYIENMQNNLLQRIDNGAAITFSLESTISGSSKSSVSYTGEIICHKDSYLIRGEGFSIFCDGENKWILNEEIDEMTVFPHDANAENIMESPLAFIRILDNFEDFTFQYGKTTYSDGNESIRITIKPKGKNAAYKEADIIMDAGTALPISIYIQTSDNSSYTFTFGDFSSIPADFDYNFKPSASLLDNPYLVITDMR